MADNVYLAYAKVMKATLRQNISANFLRSQSGPAPFWRVEKALIDYPQAVEFMEARVAAIAAGKAPEMLWLLEHPPLYTAGTSAKPKDLLCPDQLPIFNTGRGGQYTYHGPGQRVVYVMLNLQQRHCDIRAFVATLEEWIIRSLADFGIQGERREDRVGVWVSSQWGEEKIAAIGIKIRRWVSFHGIAINLNPNLSHYAGIVPCGQAAFGTTSFQKLGVAADMQQLDAALARNFQALFGEIHQ